MFYFECPLCLETAEAEGEDLPDNACDSVDYECNHCGGEMNIGWRAKIVVNSVTVEAGEVL